MPDDWSTVAQIAGATADGSRAVSQAEWNVWAASPEARLIAMLRGDHLIGFAYVFELGPAEWWVEGLRIQPDHGGGATEMALLTRVVEEFGQIGIGLLRLAVGSSHDSLAKVASDSGFRRLISYRPLAAPVLEADYRSFKLLQAANHEMAHQYMRRSPMNRVSHFAEKNWTFYYVTQERLHQYLGDPQVQVLGWRQFDQMHGLAVIHHAVDAAPVGPMQIGYVDAPDDTTFLAMLAALRGLAAKRGFTNIHWMMPLSIGLDRSVSSTDLQPSWNADLSLFERPLRV